jgi:lipoprotein-anchoring transpeptidase ErfK/SrfK
MGKQHYFCTVSALIATLAFGAPALAQPISIYEEPQFLGAAPGGPMFPDVPKDMIEDDATVPSDPSVVETPSELRRQTVSYPTREAPGTIVIDTPHTYLYYVLGGGQAIRYGIGVGREGFTWSGVQKIARKVEWPDWEPPVEMIDRQPYLPRWMAGGPGNPLGARAMYFGGTIYRIHGTSEPAIIGHHVSSGCIRMLNADAIDLYERAKIGTKVVVLPDDNRRVRDNDVASAMPNGSAAARSVPVGVPSSPVARADSRFSASGLY